MRGAMSPAAACAGALVAVGALGSFWFALWYEAEARRLRKVVEELEHGAPEASAPESGGSELPVRVIGVVRSCFRDVQGTPRQPGVVPLARSVVELDATVISSCALEGLEKHSHVWVVYVFHENTNDAKRRRGSTFPAKVRPPRGKGELRLGCLATRTPHRPSALGLSLVKLEDVELGARRLTLSGADVVDGSPVVDVKPYLPSYDSPPAGQDVCTPLAEWYGGETWPPRDVALDDGIVVAASARLRLYRGSPVAAADAVRQALAMDVSRRPRTRPYRMRFDGLLVEYTVAAPACATTVTAVSPDRDLDDAFVGRDVVKGGRGGRRGLLEEERVASLPPPPPSPLRLEAVPRGRPSPATFCDEVLPTSAAMVVEGALDDLPAMAWTASALRRRCGERRILARKSVGDDDYALGARYGVERMRFKRYVDLLEDGHTSYYMAAAHVRHAFPALVDDATPPPLHVRRRGRVHSGPFLWVAPKGHYEFTHVDPDDGWLAVLRGRKRVVLFPPHLSRAMDPNPLGADGRTVQSRVDLRGTRDQVLARAPDLPLHLARDVVLERGDSLFIPAFTWHQVTSLEASVSVNYFFGDDGANTYTAKVLHRDAFYLWLSNVFAQNLDALPSILRHLHDAIALLLKQQWAEAPSDDQLATISTKLWPILKTDPVFQHLALDDAPPPPPPRRDPSTPRPAPPPGARLKIRGLRNRGKVDFHEDKDLASHRAP